MYTGFVSRFIVMCIEGIGHNSKNREGVRAKRRALGEDAVCCFVSAFYSIGRNERNSLLCLCVTSHRQRVLFLPSLSSHSIPFLPSKSLTQVCHFFRNFIDFLPVENFFELSTSYQQFTFFDAVF